MATRAVAVATRRRHYRPRYFRRYHHRRKHFTIPLAVCVGFARPVWGFFYRAKQGNWTGEDGAFAELSRTMTGINPFTTPMKYEAWRMTYGLYPVLIGLAIHKLADYTGLNRMIARAGVPIIRL